MVNRPPPITKPQPFAVGVFSVRPARAHCWRQILPQVDHDERSEAQLHEGGRIAFPRAIARSGIVPGTGLKSAKATGHAIRIKALRADGSSDWLADRSAWAKRSNLPGPQAWTMGCSDRVGRPRRGAVLPGRWMARGQINNWTATMNPILAIGQIASAGALRSSMLTERGCEP